MPNVLYVQPSMGWLTTTYQKEVLFKMADTQKSVVTTILILFTLLGALFGAQIMTFIFGQLGPEAAGLTSADAAYNVSLQVQNNSLQAINTYSQGASTQMTVVSIVVILLLLIGLFVVFWKSFMGDGKKGSGMAGNFTSN